MIRTMKRLPVFRRVSAKESGCQCCQKCMWQKSDVDPEFRCPYGGPFLGYKKHSLSLIGRLEASKHALAAKIEGLTQDIDFSTEA